MWGRNVGKNYRKGSQRSHNRLGNRRLAKLPLIVVGKMILLATVRTWQKRVLATPMRRIATIKMRREIIIASPRGRDRHSYKKSCISWRKRERGGRHTNHDVKITRENSNKAWYTITMEKRAPKLGCDRRKKPTQVNVIIEILSITLQCHRVYGEWLIKFNLLK